jgi:hypothetical protein
MEDFAKQFCRNNVLLLKDRASLVQADEARAVAIERSIPESRTDAELYNAILSSLRRPFQTNSFKTVSCLSLLQVLAPKKSATQVRKDTSAGHDVLHIDLCCRFHYWKVSKVTWCLYRVRSKRVDLVTRL